MEHKYLKRVNEMIKSILAMFSGAYIVTAKDIHYDHRMETKITKFNQCMDDIEHKVDMMLNSRKTDAG